ncbi:spermatogenesis-associated serine-rich protein 2-like isoform X2 [Amblyomma americanum]
MARKLGGGSRWLYEKDAEESCILPGPYAAQARTWRRAENKMRSIYDTHNNVALADGEQHGPGDLKEKLSKVREVVPSMSKDQICMVLRTYDYDVNATITAISENGPEAALREWNCAGNKVKLANKNRKRKKKPKKEPAAGSMVENQDAIAAGDSKDVNLGKLDEGKDHLEEHFSCISHEDVPVSSFKQNGSEMEKYSGVSYGWGDEPPPEPLHEDEAKHEVAEIESKSRPLHSHGSGRSKSSPDVKCGDGYEVSATPSSSTLPKKTCLEKSLKDLSRQTVALQRVQVLLEEQLTKAEKAIKAAFLEVQKALSDRQAQLEEEMEKVRTDARAMLQQRQKLAAELKARSETASTLSEQSLTELRDDIKHFVVERKYDEELGKTARFVCSKEKIEKEIKDFGQVVHVRDPYTSRRLSLSSVASSTYHDSGYHQSVTSSPVYKSQYYSYDTMKEEEHGGRKFEGAGGYSRSSDSRGPDTRASKVYTNSHRNAYPGSSPGGARSGGYPRVGRNRRPDDMRYSGSDRGGGGGRGGYGGGGRPHRYSTSTGRGRYPTETGRRSREDDGTRKPSPTGVNGQA